MTTPTTTTLPPSHSTHLDNPHLALAVADLKALQIRLKETANYRLVCSREKLTYDVGVFWYVYMGEGLL